MLRFFGSFTCAWLLIASACQGQALVLKDGSRVPEAEFSFSGDQLVRTMKIGERTATAVIPWENIVSLDWPEPQELAQARDLTAKARYDEALGLLKKSILFFRPFEKVEGSWYTQLFFTYVETLNLAGKFDETVRVLPQLRTLPLTDVQKTALRVIQLDIERQSSSEFGPILAEARAILSETDDSATGASIWMIIADIHARQKEWEKALMAYLRIPVFYGTQVQRVPDAELKAGQMLVKMKRFEDAHSLFERLSETYKGSAVAEMASKEQKNLNGLKNEPEEEPTQTSDKS